MDDTSKKQCIECKQDYPSTGAFFRYSSKGIITDHCRQCLRDRQDKLDEEKEARRAEIIDLKQCIGCLDPLPSDRLGKSYCLSCYNQYRKDRRARGIGILAPEKARDKHLQRSYGITAKQYNQMLSQQKGVCAVCKQPEKGIDPRSKTGAARHLHVDHDHKTGRIRALLCHGCNAALGLLKEDTKRIRALLSYAKQHQTTDNIEQAQQTMQLTLL